MIFFKDFHDEKPVMAHIQNGYGFHLHNHRVGIR
ncbi:hypothetical protein SAI_0172, partial [Streptococcus agalactiae H36B]